MLLCFSLGLIVPQLARCSHASWVRPHSVMDEAMSLKQKYYRAKVHPKDVIKYIKIKYSEARETEPDADEHQHLSNTLLLILEGKRNVMSAERELGLWDKTTMWKSLALNETMLFSVLTYPESIRLLCLYAVYKKIPMKSFQYKEEFDRVMISVLGMYDKGTFAEVYKTRNTKTLRKMNEIELVLPNVQEMTDEGLELIKKEALDMPNRNLGPYFDAEMLRGDLSMFTRTNINNKIRCFCSVINRVKKALVLHSDSLEEMMKQAKFEDMTLLEKRHALCILARDGKDAMARYIAQEITLNADLLY